MNKDTTDLLAKYFTTAVSAPDGIKRLRELILTLAMQGKLVPQDRDDAPVSKLLKEIEAEKYRLVKDGKIKKPKPLPPIGQNEKLYALPQGWEWVRIGSIGNIFNGNSINAAEKESKYVRESGLPYIATKDVGYGFAPLDYDNGIRIPQEEKKFRVAHKGAVLICAEGGSAGKKCGLTTRDICFGNKLFANELFGSIPSRFMLYGYLSPIFRASFAAATTGIIGGVSIARFIEIAIPLPPLKEQHRIVAKIDQLMAQCDALEILQNARNDKRLATHAAALSQLLNTSDNDIRNHAWAFIIRNFEELYSVKENVAELRKTILQLAVIGKLVPQNAKAEPASVLLKKISQDRIKRINDGVAKRQKTVTVSNSDDVLPSSWEKIAVQDFADVRLGSTPSRSNPDFWQGDIPWVSSGEVANNIIYTTSEKITRSGFDSSSISIIPARSLLIAIIGQGKTRGQSALLGIDACTNQNVAALVFNEKFVLPEFAWIWAKSKYETHRSDGRGGAQPALNGEIVRGFSFPLPPFEEQQRIVKKVDHLMLLCERIEQQIDSAGKSQSKLLNALIQAHSQERSDDPQFVSGIPHKTADIVDLDSYRAVISCYALNKLANAQYFGRTAAAKVIYFAQAHIGLELRLTPEREAAGPLDTWIYDFEQQGQDKGWFEVNERTLRSGRKKTEYRCLPALSKPAAKAEALMSSEQKTKFDRLIYALADKKTEEIEIIATLFAVWNDFLIDGTYPTDQQIISEVRENWHERKARFSPTELCRWLAWLRSENIIPLGMPPRTIHQPKLRFH
nr:restriction endonuclease subunit S [Herbaspirillum sp. B39]